MNTTLLLLLVLLSDESVREKLQPIFSLLSDSQTLSLLSSALSSSETTAKREEAKEEEQKKETSDPEEVSLWLQRIMNSRQ